MKYEGTIEYMIKPTLGFGLQPNRQRASVTERLFMTMTMEIDVEYLKILVPSPLMWW
jgi:hypothetical protein